MAAAIVDNFAQDLLKSLESPEMADIWKTKYDVFGELKSMKELEKELKVVANIVRGVRDVLPGAEKKQTSSLTVRGWLEKLGDELLEANDLLDEIRYQKHAYSSNGCCNNLIGKVRLFFSSAYRLYGVRRVIEIRQNLVYIETQRPGIGHIRERNVVNQTCFQAPRGFVGRVDEKARIIKLLDVSTTESHANIPNIPPSTSPQSGTSDSTAPSHPVTDTGNISPSNQPGTNTDNIFTSNQPGANTDNISPSNQPGANMDNIFSSNQLGANTDNISSSNQPGANTDKISPSNQPDASTDNISPSNQPGANTDNISPSNQQANMDNISPSNQPGANTDNISPSNQPGANTDNISPSNQPGANTVNISPSNQPDANRNISPSNQPGTNTSNISVIALAGLPGSGKTTLVQSVCNGVNVQRHFRPKLWACVSDLLKFEEILTRILKSETIEGDTSTSSLHQQRDLLSEKIRGKKFLLVLDDLSTVDQRVWSSLRALLETGASGSRILITTRYQNVATAIASSENICKLGALSEDDSWLLFKSIAHSETQEQEQIGKDIVRRCENFPLIITVAANLVAHKTNWQQFRDKNLDIMDMFTRHKNRHLLNVLRPSYDQLNPHLKHCVAYCSLFPRDYEFRKQTLIQLWMAQGFLKLEDNSGSSSNLEDIGEKQFQILLNMSFFEAAKQDALGDIVSWRMHKMFHHLAQNEAGTRCVMASGNTKFDNKTLHISAKLNGSFPDALLTARKLRTLLCHKESECELKLSRSICQMIILKLKRLRTLNLSDCGIDVLPDNVGDLIHLRFLDLSKNYSLVAVPESITKLSNLQLLNINLCQQLKWLPRSIGRLAMLRCLEIEECDSLTFMPLGLQKLTSLRSLNRFVVCVPSEANDDSGGIEVLKGLNNLRGRLKISGEWTEQVQNSSSANLRGKRDLTDLNIEWRVGASDYTRTCHYYEAILEGLHPPSNLTVLCIEGYQGRDFPSWAKADKLPTSLKYLVTVSIEGCKECKEIPAFGELEYLKHLTLRNMEAVQYMVDEIYDPESKPTQLSMFKSLTELTLHSFYSLKGWWKEAKVTEKHGLPSFPQLSKLKIWNCPKLASMPLFNKVVEVDFQDVDQKLLEMSSLEVEPSKCRPSTASKIHKTLSDFSYDPSSKVVSYGLLQKLTKLKTLNIKACPKMQSFPTVWDECIQSLVIDKCDGLTSVSKGLRRLKSLEMLEISHCNKLWDDIKSFPWSSLTKLRHLTFRGFSQMKAFPEGSEMINAIKTVEVFHIARCNDLTDLPDWIEQMSSLKHLRLEACPNLTKLPQGSECLRGLDKLEIMECPQLMERFREGGEDRSKLKRHAQVLLHKSWRYGLANNAERTSEAMPFQFAVNDTTVTLARKCSQSSWEDVTFKSKIKAV
ncbi:hypothetical protein RND81_07G054500 [Saponaria officinalis]|uniref:Uncharacterized protein n=1 Tax=Saponaria officinalis TaxID=3572 RepID=A0AAW1JKI0_SAPOF